MKSLWILDIGLRWDYFKNDLVDKKKEIVKHYRFISQQINKIDGYISSNKIKLAKNELGSLYMNFCNSRKFIDLKYYNLVDEFKSNFLSDIGFGTFIWCDYFKKSNVVKSQIKFLSLKFEE